MENLASRQSKILAAIVKEYSQTSDPVGSKELEEKYNFQVSPATIRNEMRALEKAGYIFQPHTSAGRVPTDKGYRYFVNHLMKHLELTMQEQRRLEQEVLRLKKQHYELGQSITRLLAKSSNAAAFALLPEAQSASGFSNIVNGDLSGENLRAVADFLDNLQPNCQALIKQDSRNVQTYIGRDSPIPLSEDISMVVAKVSLPDGQKGVVGLVGSKRMKYAKNISLLEYVSKLITGGMGSYLIIINF